MFYRSIIVITIYINHRHQSLGILYSHFMQISFFFHFLLTSHFVDTFLIRKWSRKWCDKNNDIHTCKLITCYRLTVFTYSNILDSFDHDTPAHTSYIILWKTSSYNTKITKMLWEAHDAIKDNWTSYTLVVDVSAVVMFVYYFIISNI